MKINVLLWGIIKCVLSPVFVVILIPFLTLSLIYEVGRGYHGSCYNEPFDGNPFWKPMKYLMDWNPFKKQEYSPEVKK